VVKSKGDRGSCHLVEGLEQPSFISLSLNLVLLLVERLAVDGREVEVEDDSWGEGGLLF
jgi:hypothetical protein